MGQKVLSLFEVAITFQCSFLCFVFCSTCVMQILSLIAQGAADPTITGNMFIPSGSFANGGSMRIAPLGLAFRHAPAPVLLEAVKAALLATHTHPDGIAGAMVQAAAVAWLQGQGLQQPLQLQQQQQQLVVGKLTDSTATSTAAATAAGGGDGVTAASAAAAGGGGVADAGGLAGYYGPAALLAHLRSTCGSCSVLMDAKLSLLQESVAAAAAAAASAVAGGSGSSNNAALVGGSFSVIGSAGWSRDSLCKEGRWAEYFSSKAWADELALSAAVAPGFQIAAVDAVAAALCALVCHWSHPEDAVVAAVHYGGDTDTIASMAGSLAGALHGSDWVPERWVRAIENGVVPAVDELPAATVAAKAAAEAVAAGVGEGGPGAGGLKDAFQEVLTWRSTRGMGRDAALRLADALVLVDWM